MIIKSKKILKKKKKKKKIGEIIKNIQNFGINVERVE